MEDHITKNESPKNMSIEQAGNYLADKTKTMAEDIKKESRKAPITLAPERDRKAYLMYGISILDDISETAKNLWCKISNKAPAMYSTKEVAVMFKKLLVLRINGYSLQIIAQHLHTTIPVIEQTEELAVKVVCEAIEKREATGIPIIGGKN